MPFLLIHGLFNLDSREPKQQPIKKMHQTSNEDYQNGKRKRRKRLRRNER